MNVLYWSPYVGHAGTIKAVVNSARAFCQYGGHKVTLIKNHSEWEGNEALLQSSGVKIIDFGLKKVFSNLYQTKPLGSRQLRFLAFLNFLRTSVSIALT